MKKLLALFLVLFPFYAHAGSQQTSATTGTVFIADVRLDYNDTTTAYFTDAEMLEFLNDGMVDIANKSHCLEASQSVTLVANTIEYSISTNYVEVVAVVYNPASGASKGLIKGTIKDVGMVQGAGFGDTGVPAFWYEFNGKIGIYPALGSVTTQTATVYLAARPTAIAAGTNVTIPASYENALKLYMMARMAMKDKNHELYSALMAQYSAELNAYRQDLTEQK